MKRLTDIVERCATADSDCVNGSLGHSPASLLEAADELKCRHQLRAAVRVYFRVVEGHGGAREASLAVRRLRRIAQHFLLMGNSDGARRIGSRLARAGHA